LTTRWRRHPRQGSRRCPRATARGRRNGGSRPVRGHRDAERQQLGPSGLLTLSRAARGDPGRGSLGSRTFRLPDELLIELGDTDRELQLPIGLIVTAAITHLLDQPPATIATILLPGS
jgi:hypothetical protein